MTKLHLAINPSDYNAYPDLKKSKYILTSYFYCKNASAKELQEQHENFILDSGAFSFMMGKELTKEELIKYADNYADFVLKNDIKNYVELDVDSIYGYDFTLELRKRLENRTGRQCIPIWHLSRGKEEFIKMTKEYNYAGIGGIAAKGEITKYKHLYKQLNLLANSNGCKLHGMGFTPRENLNQYGFYSVDSTSWIGGFRFGTIYKFENDKLKRTCRKDKRIVDGKGLNRLNLREWLKYQKYVDT